MSNAARAILSRVRALSVPSGFGLYILLALAIEATLALYYVARHKAFAFIDIGSDTFFSFYPLQLAVTRQFRALHDFTWSFDLSLGGYMAVAFDPAWLVTPLFPESWQMSLRLPLFLARLLLAGGFFYGYLKLIGFESRLRVFGALAYAFCSYGVTNGQWEISHGTEFVLLAFYLFAIEAYLRERKRWPAVVVGALLALSHPINPYMFALFALVYSCARLAFRREFAASIKGFAGFAAYCFLGVLLAAPMLLPAAYYLLENPRVSGNHSMQHALLASLFSLSDRSALTAEFAGLLGKDLLGTGSAYQGWGNYFEAPGFYVGVLTVLCIPQLFGPTAKRRERWLGIAGCSLVALYFVWPALRNAVYGFGESVFRFSSLWVSAALLIMGVTGLRRTLDSGPWRAGILVGVAGVLGIVLACVFFLPQVVSFEHVARIAGFCAVYAVILWTATEPAWRRQMVDAVLVLFACELLLFAVPPVVQRQAVAADGSSPLGRYDDGTSQALAMVRGLDHDGEFYRIEKTFNSVFLCDSLVQDYSGIKSYYFHSSSVTRFVDRMGIPHVPASPNYITSAADRLGVLSLVGVKYMFTRDRSFDGVAPMAYVGTAGGVNVYRNDAAHSFGYFYDHLADEAKADALPTFDRDAFLLDTVIVADPAAVTKQLAALDNSAAAQPNLSPRAQLRKVRDDRIEGEMQTPRAKTLLLAMPYDRGWTAAMDGKDLELFRADYGLTAALVPAGRHTLALNYEPPGRRLGWWLALGAAIALLGSYWMSRIKMSAPRHMLSDA